MHQLLLLFLLIAAFRAGDALHILGVYPTPHRSHAQLGRCLMKALAAAGHNVTLIGTLAAQPTDQFSTVLVDEYDSTNRRNKFRSQSESAWSAALNHLHGSLRTTEHTLAHPDVRRLLENEPPPAHHFDCVVHEAFMDEALLGIGAHFDAVTVAVSPVGAYALTDMMHQPRQAAAFGWRSPSHTPHITLGYTERMDFGQRLWNTLITLAEAAFLRLVYMPAHQLLYERYFPVESRNVSLRDLQRNVALVLLNTHHSLGAGGDDDSPVAGGAVQVGGMHLLRDDELRVPDAIRRFLDGAVDGVVVCSMGTILRTSDMPADKRAAFERAFERLGERRGVRVLWQCDSEKSDSSSNTSTTVLRQRWLPQLQAVLAHANVRVLITHGGLHSCMEAVQHGVPIVGVPIYGDQAHNVARAVAAGYAVRVDWNDVRAESVGRAVKMVLDDQRFAQTARGVSLRWRDRLMEPLAEAVWSIEWAVRNRGEFVVETAQSGFVLWLGCGLVLVVVVWILFQVLRWFVRSKLKIE